MTDYRLFILNGAGIREGIEFEATSDYVAIKHAEEVRKGRAAELWSRARTVQTFAEGETVKRG